MDKIMKEIADRMERDLFATICGPARKQPQTDVIAAQLDDASGHKTQAVRGSVTFRKIGGLILMTPEPVAADCHE